MSELDQIRAFVAIADKSSVTLAAKALGRDATVLSRRLQMLEARLGTSLIERTTRHVGLTEDGARFLSRVGPVLRALEAAENEMRDRSSSDPSGHLRVSLPSSFGRRWIAPLIEGFLEAYPSISIHADFSDRVVDLLREQFDLAVRIGDLPDSSIKARKVAERRDMLCVAPAHPLLQRVSRPLDLAGEPVLCTVDRGRRPWSFAGKGGAVEHVSIGNIRLSSNNVDLLLDAARRGVGVLNATDWDVRRDLEAGTLVALLPDFTQPDPGAIYIVTLRGSTKSPAKTRMFARWISDGLRQSERTLVGERHQPPHYEPLVDRLVASPSV